MNTEPKSGSQTPWGRAENVTPLIAGVIAVSTPSHGGIWLSPERYAQIPEAAKVKAARWSPAQWFEEDCEVASVALAFPDELRAAGYASFVDAVCEAQAVRP